MRMMLCFGMQDDLLGYILYSSALYLNEQPKG